MDDRSSSSLEFPFFYKEESGMESSVMIMNTMIVIAPQKYEIITASFLRMVIPSALLSSSN